MRVDSHDISVPYYNFMQNRFFLLQVIDSKGHILYQKEEISKGKFAFTTEEYDMFEVCFETRVLQGKSAFGLGILFIVYRAKVPPVT